MTSGLQPFTLEHATTDLSPEPMAGPDVSPTRRVSKRHGKPPRKRQVAVVVGLVAVVISAPLLIGGGPAWAQVLSILLSALVGCFALATRAHGVRMVPLTTLGLLALGATALQLIPLPRAWLLAVSPHALAIRGAAGADTAGFFPITLDLPATLLEAAKCAAYLGLFLVTAAVARRPRHARLLLLALASLGGVVALTYLLHRAFGAERIFGLYVPREHAGLGAFAPFVNGNQAAALLVLSALVALGVAAQHEGPIRAFALACLGLSLVVLPLTGARSAFAALLLAMTVFGGRILARRFGWMRASLIALLLVVSAGVPAVLTSDVLRARLGGNIGSMLDNQKTRGWRDAANLIRDYPWVGVGRGAFEGPIARYRRESEGIRLAYPETLPLQIASEWGLPASLALLALALIAFAKLAPWVRHIDLASQAAALGVAAVLLQDLAGFALELTGVAVPAVVAAGLVVGRIEERRDPARKASRRFRAVALVAAAMVWVATAVAALWAQPRTAWAEGERLRKVVETGAPAGTALMSAIRRHPADAYLALLAHIDARRHAPDQAERHLQRAMALFAADGTLEQAAARWMIQTARPAQAALAYRKAAEQGVHTDLRELHGNLGPTLMAEAVPQTYEELWGVARFLLQEQQTEVAIAASARAVEAASDKAHAALERLHLASVSGSEAFVEEAAEDLMLATQTAAGFVAAAEALASRGSKARAMDAIARGLRRHPGAAALVTKGAALYMAHDELDAAAALLRLPEVRRFEVPDQVRVQELLATLAERQGDLVGAVTARARARVLSAAGGGRTRSH